MEVSPLMVALDAHESQPPGAPAPTHDPVTKRCPHCDTAKPESDFSPSNWKKKSGWCRPCTAEAAVVYAEKRTKAKAAAAAKQAPPVPVDAEKLLGKLLGGGTATDDDPLLRLAEGILDRQHDFAKSLLAAIIERESQKGRRNG